MDQLEAWFPIAAPIIAVMALFTVVAAGVIGVPVAVRLLRRGARREPDRNRAWLWMTADVALAAVVVSGFRSLYWLDLAYPDFHFFGPPEQRWPYEIAAQTIAVVAATHAALLFVRSLWESPWPRRKR